MHAELSLTQLYPLGQYLVLFVDIVCELADVV